MCINLKYFINGEWIELIGNEMLDVINFVIEKLIGKISLGIKEDLDKVVVVVKVVFFIFLRIIKEEWIKMFCNIVKGYEKCK